MRHCRGAGVPHDKGTRSPRHWRWTATVPILAALAALTGTHAEASAPGPPMPPPLARAVLRTAILSPAPCPFRLEARIRCATLTVPEDWSKPAGRRLRLAVATIPTRAPRAATDPVLFLTGGPGVSAFAASGELAAAPDTGRDVIVIEPRGYGYSEPDLRCGGALDACRAALVAQGIDLAQYRSSTTSDDLEALRLATGTARWNVLGFSYGGFLTATYARRYPAGIRSMILDSPVSPETGMDNSDRSRFATVMRAVDSCAAQTACAAAFPGLKQRTMAALEALVGRGEASGEASLSDLLDSLAAVMHDSSTLPWTPALLDLLVRGEPDEAKALGDYLEKAMLPAGFDPARTGPSLGLFTSVTCADYGHVRPMPPIPLAPDTPAWVVKALDDADGGAADEGEAAGRSACRRMWPVPATGSWISAPLRTPIPALVLSGVYDNVTPTASVERLAAGLPHATLLVDPTASHTVLNAGSRCIWDRVIRFLAAPGTRVAPCPATAAVAWKTRLPDL